MAVAIGLGVAVCAAGAIFPEIERWLLRAPTNWPGGEFVLFEVKPGTPAKSVAQELERCGLIRRAWAFTRLVRKRGWEGKLHSGLYKIEPGAAAEDIARRMVDHDTWRIKVTIPEGLTLRQIAERIEKAGAVEGGQWLPRAAEIEKAASAAYLQKVTGITIPTVLAEGYLYPDTYFFPAGSSACSIVEKMFREFVDQFATRHAEEIRRCGRSLHEIVTLASIVEGEAEVDQERPLIAQVFLNRLALGMRLQSCATVQYALPQRKARLSVADTKINSPYNTYRHAGLPPGPICSPGYASLLAALRPQATDALFFVSRGDGTHQFSRTAQEHYQAMEALRGRGEGRSG